MRPIHEVRVGPRGRVLFADWVDTRNAAIGDDSLFVRVRRHDTGASLGWWPVERWNAYGTLVPAAPEAP